MKLANTFFAFTQEEKQFTWTIMPQGFTESLSYFPQILTADLDNIKSPRGSILLQYVDDLLHCSPSQASSQESSIHLTKLLVLKECKVAKENLQFVQTQVQYLGHLVSEQGLHLHPDRLHGVLSFPKPKTKHQLQGFLRLVGYYQNCTLNLSLMAKPLYVLLNNNNPDPIL